MKDKLQRTYSCSAFDVPVFESTLLIHRTYLLFAAQAVLNSNTSAKCTIFIKLELMVIHLKGKSSNYCKTMNEVASALDDLRKPCRTCGKKHVQPGTTNKFCRSVVNMYSQL